MGVGLFHNLSIHWYAFMHNAKFKAKVHRIVFDTDTRLGRLFDFVLISFILLSVIIVMLESGRWLPLSWKPYMHFLEWIFTAFFTLEYFMRLYCAQQAREYAFSFFGIIDFLSTFPSYLAFVFPAAHGLLVMRMFRLLRVFRIFKLFDYMAEGHILLQSLRDSMHKVVVFFMFAVVMVVSIGTIMFMVEHGKNGDNFNSISNSIYWATVTMTTVGYGDIAPVTTLGRFLAGVVMLIGYTVLAVPTGIFTVSMVNMERKRKSMSCPHCGKPIDKDSKFCKYCGYNVEKVEDLEAQTETDI